MPLQLRRDRRGFESGKVAQRGSAPAPGVGCLVAGRDFLQKIRDLGGAGGRLKGGRVLDYKEKPERQMCRLYLSMMDKMDVRLPRFGDAARALEEI